MSKSFKEWTGKIPKSWERLCKESGVTGGNWSGDGEWRRVRFSLLCWISLIERELKKNNKITVSQVYHQVLKSSKKQWRRGPEYTFLPHLPLYLPLLKLTVRMETEYAEAKWQLSSGNSSPSLPDRLTHSDAWYTWAIIRPNTNR